MNLDADWEDASGDVWFIYVKYSDVRGIFPEGHIVTCCEEKPKGNPNFGGGILHSVCINVNPSIWGRIVRGEMKIIDKELVDEIEPRRKQSWDSQHIVVEN